MSFGCALSEPWPPVCHSYLSATGHQPEQFGERLLGILISNVLNKSMAEIHKDDIEAGPNARTDARWERTRRKLLEGGREVFAECGVEAASVQQIVRAAGVSQPSFYNHFKSKDELALEMAAEFFRQDKLAKKAVFDQIEDPAEAIAINVYHTLMIAVDDPVIAWALIRSSTLRDLIISSDNDPLVGMITEGVIQKRFDVDYPHTVAVAIRAGALAVVQKILAERAEEGAITGYQELVLRMLGLSPEESATVVAHAGEHLTRN